MSTVILNKLKEYTFQTELKDTNFVECHII